MPRILAVGDSLTTGTYGVRSYRAELAEKLRADGARFAFVGPRTIGTAPLKDWWHPYHAAWDGATASEVADEASWLAQTYRPHIVLMAVGSNDARLGRPVHHVMTDVRHAIDRYRAVGAEVILAAIPARHRPMESRAHLVSMNQGLSELARSLRIGWVGAYDLHQEATVDGVHPTDEGERLLAAAWYRALTTCGTPTIIQTT